MLSKVLFMTDMSSLSLSSLTLVEDVCSECFQLTKFCIWYLHSSFHSLLSFVTFSLFSFEPCQVAAALLEKQVIVVGNDHRLVSSIMYEFTCVTTYCLTRPQFCLVGHFASIFVSRSCYSHVIRQYDNISGRTISLPLRFG